MRLKKMDQLANQHFHHFSQGHSSLVATLFADRHEPEPSLDPRAVAHPGGDAEARTGGQRCQRHLFAGKDDQRARRKS